MEKLILEQSIMTICLGCGHFREHTVAVASTLHFSWGEDWKGNLDGFVVWLAAQEKIFPNFNEAYLAFCAQLIL